MTRSVSVVLPCRGQSSCRALYKVVRCEIFRLKHALLASSGRPVVVNILCSADRAHRLQLCFFNKSCEACCTVLTLLEPLHRIAHRRLRIMTHASADLLHSAPVLIDAAAATSHHTLAALHQADLNSAMQPLTQALQQLQQLASSQPDTVNAAAAASALPSSAALESHSFAALYDLADAAAASVSGGPAPAVSTAVAQRSQDWLTPIADGLEWVLQVMYSSTSAFTILENCCSNPQCICALTS